MADVMQKLVLKGNQRAVIMAFRGAAKSWIASALSLWVLYWWPGDNILVESAAKNRADEFSSFTLRLIDEMEILKPLRPTDKQRRRQDSYEVAPAGASHSPSLRAVGIGGQRVGARSDLTIADDIEVDTNSDTDVQREQLFKAAIGNEALAKPKVGTIILLGTPHTELTLYKRLEAAGYQIFVWPARYPDARLQKVHQGRLAPYILEALARDPNCVGQPTEPTRFGEDDLQLRESKGRSWFALQYMLDTSLADAVRYPLHISDLMIDDLDPRMGPGGLVWSGSPEYRLEAVSSPGFEGDHFHRPWKRLGEPQPWQGCIVQVDPSGAGGDEMAACAMGMLNGNVFLFEVLGMKGGYDDANLQAVAELAQRWNANLVRVESNFGMGSIGKLLMPFLNRIHPCAVEDKPSTKRKEVRIIDALEPLMNGHKLIVNTKVVHDDAYRRPEDGDMAIHYSLFHQMTRITREKGCLRHDDRLDCIALAAAYWAEKLGIDQNVAIARRERDQADAELLELRREMNASIGVKAPVKLDHLEQTRKARNLRADPRNSLRSRRFHQTPPAPERPRPILISVPILN